MLERDRLAWHAIACAPLSFALATSAVVGCGSIISPGSPPFADATVPVADVDSGEPGSERIDAGAADGSLANPEPLADAYAEREPLDATAVTGTVVDRLTRRPLRGRTISIGGKTTVTDDNGWFAVATVEPVYDVTITEPDHSRISVYQRLTRRDPLLVHKSSDVPDPTIHTASVGGTLSGAGSYPLSLSDLVAVNFFSREAAGHVLLGGGLPAVPRGPDYGPITLRWNGAGAVAGQLVAVGIFSSAEDGGRSIWLSHKTLTVATDEAPAVNLVLAPAAQGHVAGSIHVPPGETLGFKSISYRLPVADSEINLVTDEDALSSFDYVLPDFGDAGGALCLTAEGSGGSSTMQCGVTPGAGDVSVTLQSPPSFAGLIDGSTVTTDALFAFTHFDGGVQKLELVSTAPTPSIDVFTAATSVSPIDLQSAGAALVAGAGYRCRVVGLGPFNTIDDAAGPGGLSAPFPAEQRQSRSSSIQVTFAP